jgi:hypothetical protein
MLIGVIKIHIISYLLNKMVMIINLVDIVLEMDLVDINIIKIRVYMTIVEEEGFRIHKIKIQHFKLIMKRFNNLLLLKINFIFIIV